jgi:hypothetical protein
MIITVLKYLIGLFGLGITLAYFIPGLLNKEKAKLKKAGLIFVSTWLLLIIISIIEFAILTHKP